MPPCVWSACARYAAHGGQQSDKHKQHCKNKGACIIRRAEGLIFQMRNKQRINKGGVQGKPRKICKQCDKGGRQEEPAEYKGLIRAAKPCDFAGGSAFVYYAAKEAEHVKNYNKQYAPGYKHRQKNISCVTGPAYIKTANRIENGGILQSVKLLLRKGTREGAAEGNGGKAFFLPGEAFHKAVGKEAAALGNADDGYLGTQNGYFVPRRCRRKIFS